MSIAPDIVVNIEGLVVLTAVIATRSFAAPVHASRVTGPKLVVARLGIRERVAGWDTMGRNRRRIVTPILNSANVSSYLRFFGARGVP